MKTFSSSILLALLATSVFSQCPTFYTNYNLQGNSFQLCASNNVPAIYNDQTSSFTVPAGYMVTLYHDVTFSGEYWGPYTAGSYNVPTSFNDQLSSVSVFPVQTQIPNCPVFYRDYGLAGPSVQVCTTGNVPSGWNDIISSMYIPPDYAVELYQNANAGGSVFGPFNSGAWDVPLAINDQTSYISISNFGNSDSTDSELNTLQCPVFYFNSNLQGTSFQMCSSGNVPSADNNQASSLIVPKGYSVYIYGNSNYGGDYWGPFTEGRYNIPPNLDNQVSSVIINTPNGQAATINSVSNPITTAPATTVTNTETTSTSTNTETTNTNTETTNNGGNGGGIAIPIPIIVPTLGTGSGNGNGGNLFGIGSGNGGNLFGFGTGNGNSNGNSNNNNNNNNGNSGNCPTFYVDVNEGGKSFQMCSSGNVPSGFNDVVSSLVVPVGYSVDMYADVNSGGQHAGPYLAGKYNVPANFNDKMSSAVITKLF